MDQADKRDDHPIIIDIPPKGIAKNKISPDFASSPCLLIYLSIQFKYNGAEKRVIPPKNPVTANFTEVELGRRQVRKRPKSTEINNYYSECGRFVLCQRNVYSSRF